MANDEYNEVEANMRSYTSRPVSKKILLRSLLEKSHRSGNLENEKDSFGFMLQDSKFETTYDKTKKVFDSAVQNKVGSMNEIHPVMTNGHSEDSLVQRNDKLAMSFGNGDAKLSFQTESKES